MSPTVHIKRYISFEQIPQQCTGVQQRIQTPIGSKAKEVLPPVAINY